MDKKPLWKKWWFWLILVIVLAGIGGAMNDKPSKVNNTKNASNSNSKDESSNIEEKIFAIGDEVKLKDNILIVNGIEKSAGSDFDKPKDGYEFIIVNVTIKNGGSSEISYTPYDFELQNSKGEINDLTILTFTDNNYLNSGSLAAGGQTSGTVAFEAPINDSGLILKYKANMFDNNEIKVKLN